MCFTKSGGWKFAIGLGLLPFVSHAQGTFKGVVTDSVNGMPLAGVAVSAGGASTLTDAKGAFTLVASGTGIGDFSPSSSSPAADRRFAYGSLAWRGYAADGKWTGWTAGRGENGVPPFLGK